ncbi:MAG: hypothetical protein DCC66_10140, partial [Planctomycetota bacterium]
MAQNAKLTAPCGVMLCAAIVFSGHVACNPSVLPLAGLPQNPDGEPPAFQWDAVPTTPAADA